MLGFSLACAKARGKPVLIDFIGDACVNCREMEAAVWAEPNVLTLLDQYVPVSLYVAVNALLPDGRHYVFPYDNKVKKSQLSACVGAQTEDFGESYASI